LQATKGNHFIFRRNKIALPFAGFFFIYNKNKLMEKFAILARVEAKAGKEKEVLEFLKSALPLAEGEPGTVRWYALQIGPSTFGIFDTFETEEGRKAHLNGPIAAALMANASALLAKDPVIEMVDLLAVK
jgi:quinol monooxygenase YgiN